MSAPTASIEVLKKSLEANGLSTSGTKVEMLQRLLHNKGDGRKGGGKAKAEKKMPAITSTTKDPAFEAFKESERTSLIASGITDEAALKEEIDRRWSVLQSLKPAPPKAVTPTSKKMEVVLDAAQLAELNLIYAGPTTDGMHMYIDKPSPAAPAAAAASGKKKKDAASPSKEGDDVVASPPGTAMASAEKAAMKVAFSSKKRKTDEEQEQPDEAEDEDEPDMKWACEITAMRLLKKAKKEHLIPLLEDFGVPTKGSKEELSTLLSEQLHYETDSGDDE